VAKLAVEYKLTAGPLTSATGSEVGGPVRLLLERDMSSGGESLDVELRDRSGVAPGDPVTLELGYDGETELVFTGEVAVVSPSLNGARITALGKMNSLMRLRAASFYEGRSAGAIVKDLAGRAGLDIGTVDDGPELPRYAVDTRLSGYQHCRELAERLGFELYTNREGKVMFRALGAAASLDSGGLGGVAGAAAGALGLGGGEGYEYGKHLVAGLARRATPAGDKVEVAGESPMSAQGDSSAHWLTPEANDYRGEAGNGDLSALFADMAARTSDLANRFAEGYRATLRRASASTAISIFGRPSLELGDTLAVSAAPDGLLNGSYYIRAIRHRFSRREGFLTDLRLSPEGGA
jgi:phage protein D